MSFPIHSMYYRLIFSIFLLLPNLLCSQLEIEGSVGYDVSKLNVTAGDNIDLEIRDRPKFDNSFGFALNLYSKINPKIRLGIGVSAYARKEILLIDYNPGIVIFDRVEFQDLRLNFGLKQMILKNIYLKLNANIHSIYKPIIFRNALNSEGGSIDKRRIFIGPEIRIGYTIKNVFIEIYGFKNIKAFDDPPEAGRTFNLDGIDKDFSLGVNLGYTLNYPSKKKVERKSQERIR